MIDIFKLADHDGKIKVITKDKTEHIGTFCCIMEQDEDDDFTDDMLYIDCEDGPWGFFRYEIEKIELLD